MKKVLFLVALFALSVLIAVPTFAANEANSTAIAAPSFNNSGLGWGNGLSGWSVESGGLINVESYAKGTKSADTTSFATGTAWGIGGAGAIQTPHFGFGASGALSGVTLVGAGYGLGIDKLTLSGLLHPFSNVYNPDFASVKICYIGGAEQSNGILVDNGYGTFVTGGNNTGVIFWGGSYNESDGKLLGILDFGIPALAVGADGAGALAGGYTIGGYIDTPNFAAADVKTFGFSGYVADAGIVYGEGCVQHQAVVGNGGSFGVSAGQASFGYLGTGSLGYGSAQTGGWTKITNGPGSSSVTSFSSSHSSSHVN
jgi:hypothetical protein